MIMLYKVKPMKNYKLNSLDGEIGKVKDLYFDDQTWKIKYFIVDTGNWLSSRQVLISPHAITAVNNDDSNLSINLTKNQIEESPVLETDKPVSMQFQNEYNGHYMYPMYGATGNGIGMEHNGVGGAIPNMHVENDADRHLDKLQDDNDWDPHLRSTQQVINYGIQSLDDTLGHVEDFVVDTENWQIQYFEVDTKNLFPGKKILISPNWIDHISWTESLVFVNLGSDEIKDSPEYTDETLLDRDFETQLHKHYNRSGYWLDDQEYGENTRNKLS